MATLSTAYDAQSTPIVMDRAWEKVNQERSNKMGNSSSMLCSGAKIKSTYFATSRQTLLTALELSRAYQRILTDDHSLARHMNVPLMSDILAEKISHLFSEARPHILEIGAEEKSNDITWVDVIREGSFHTEHQNEKFRLRLRNREAVVEMTQFDYDLILSGMPWKLVHPQSHASDILAEISAIDLVASEMRIWKGIVAKISETIDDTLKRLTEKLNKVDESDIAQHPSQQSAFLPEANPQDVAAGDGSPDTMSSGKKRTCEPHLEDPPSRRRI
ncbi:hypothetical protein N7476_004709 [Penicillium atrosanguineum]|uniref:Uncharacterized protein n=1 Tax=Penicillium atrosanguineum TaxID=1132637 RepID=A0A9W9PY19_9EURO|nr:hypothetical protein N7476_004709 [Penicillium atrosanguineum]